MPIVLPDACKTMIRLSSVISPCCRPKRLRKIDHRNDRAAEVDQALDVMRRLRNPRDLRDQDDLADLGDFDPVQFLVELEADKLKRSVVFGNGVFIRSAVAGSR